MLFPIYLIAFLSFASMAVLYPVVPPYASSLGASVAQVGVVVAVQSYVGAVLQAPGGILSDRVGRRTMVIGGISANVVAYVLYLFASSVGALMAVRTINGITNSAFYPAAAALVVDLAPQEKRGEALGIFATGTQTGNMVGPAVGGFVLEHLGFQAAFLCSAAISLLALLVALFGLRSLRSTGRPVGGHSMTFGWLRGRKVIGGLLGTMFVLVGIGGIISFLPLYGFEINIDIARVGLIISTVYLGSVLTRVVAGRTSDRVGRAPVILSGLFLCATGVFLMSIFTGPVPLHLAALIYGFGMGSALPACTALVADVAPLRMRGFAMGMNSGSFSAGQALGATFLGIVAASEGFARMYLLTAAVITLAMALVLVLTRKSRVESRV